MKRFKSEIERIAQIICCEIIENEEIYHDILIDNASYSADDIADSLDNHDKWSLYTEDILSDMAVQFEGLPKDFDTWTEKQSCQHIAAYNRLEKKFEAYIKKVVKPIHVKFERLISQIKADFHELRNKHIKLAYQENTTVKNDGIESWQRIIKKEGKDYRDRERIKRKISRWIKNIQEMSVSRSVHWNQSLKRIQRINQEFFTSIVNGYN